MKKSFVVLEQELARKKKVLLLGVSLKLRQLISRRKFVLVFLNTCGKFVAI